MKSMTNVLAIMNSVFTTAIRSVYPAFTQTKALIQPTSDDKFGDYKCIAAMPISQVHVCCVHVLYVCVFVCVTCVVCPFVR